MGSEETVGVVHIKVHTTPKAQSMKEIIDKLEFI